MKKEDVEIGKKYKIMFSDQFKGKVAKCRGIYRNGDAALEFKNGKRVIYNATWLEAL